MIIIFFSYCSDFSHLLLQSLANTFLGIFTKTKKVCVSESKSLLTKQILQMAKEHNFVSITFKLRFHVCHQQQSKNNQTIPSTSKCKDMFLTTFICILV